MTTLKRKGTISSKQPDVLAKVAGAKKTAEAPAAKKHKPGADPNCFASAFVRSAVINYGGAEGR